MSQHRKTTDELVADFSRAQLLEMLWLTFHVSQGKDTDNVRQAVLDRLAVIDGVTLEKQAS